MKKIFHILFACAAAIAALQACSCVSGRSENAGESAGDILEAMRADTSFIHVQDSIACLAIGGGTRCLDPVKHLFRTESGEFYLLNTDWGGCFRLPQGWIPEDDEAQAVVSFHGTHVWSPDSLALVSTYAGLQPFIEDDFDEYVTELCNWLSEDDFVIRSVDREMVLIEGGLYEAVRISAENGDGILYYGKNVYDSPHHVEYKASVQFTADWNGDSEVLLSALDAFPCAPGERPLVGYAI